MRLALLLTLFAVAASADCPRTRCRADERPRASSRAARCAVTLQGAAFPVGDWTPSNLSSSNPTLTGSYGAGPPGSCSSTGAARLQTASTSGDQYSAILNKNGTSAHSFCPETAGAPISFGCWAKAASAVTFDFGAFDSTVGHDWRVTSFIATTSWQWFEVENLPWRDCNAGGNNSCQFLIGGAPVINSGQAARPAADLQLYGCRCVNAATISP